jgi:hypothetical protein
MTSESPPTRRSGPLATDRFSVETPTDTASVARALRRRREAARGADPWVVDQADWRDHWDLRMARLGWAPQWQRERACAAWERGVR